MDELIKITVNLIRPISPSKSFALKVINFLNQISEFIHFIAKEKLEISQINEMKAGNFDDTEEDNQD